MSGEYLGQNQYDEISQWVSALDFEKDVLGLPIQFQKGPGFDQLKNLYYTAAWNTVTQIGYYDQAKGGGGDAYKEVLALRYLISKRKINGTEADAWLRQKYPDQKWGSGAWKKKSGSVAAAKAADKSQEKTKTGKPQSQKDLATTANGQPAGAQNSFTGGFGFGSATGAPVVIDTLPEEYSAERMAETLESAFNQVSADFAALSSGRALRLDPGTLNGSVIAPGSLSAQALSPLDIEKTFVSPPPPEHALGIKCSRSSSADRWATDGSTTGPGRIWQANTVVRPKGWKPRAGVARYRLPLADLQFGVMSILMRSDSWTAADFTDNMEVRYGVVISGIPNVLGRPPMNLRFMQYGEDAPSQMKYAFQDGGFNTNPPWQGTKVFFESKADSLFHSTAKPAWEAYDVGGTDGTLSATSQALETIEGVSIQLLTARTTEGIWQQLNTRVPYVGAGTTTPAHGPMLTSPVGLEMLPPCCPSVLEWDGDASASAQYDHLESIAAAESSTRLTQGLPFLFSDCSRLTARNATFSIVLQVIGYETSNVTGTWAKAPHWHEHGLKAPLAQFRDWTLDFVVE